MLRRGMTRCANCKRLPKNQGKISCIGRPTTTFVARFLREIWLSPNARDKPPSDPRGVIRIARKLYRRIRSSVMVRWSRNGRLKITTSAAASHDPSAGPLAAMIRIPAVYPGWRTKA